MIVRLHYLGRSVERARLGSRIAADALRGTIDELSDCLTNLVALPLAAACGEGVKDTLRGIFTEEADIDRIAATAPLFHTLRLRYAATCGADLESLIRHADWLIADAEAVLADALEFEVAVAENPRLIYERQRRERFASQFEEMERESQLENERVAAAQAAREEKFRASQEALREAMIGGGEEDEHETPAFAHEVIHARDRDRTAGLLG